jgi:trk system potassium uptake protein TrkH
MSAVKLEPLSYSVRGRVVLRYLGQLLLVLAGMSLPIVAVSLAFGEFVLSAWYGGTICALALLGFLLNKVGVSAEIQSNEGLVISALIFIVTALAMAVPMAASGLRFEDALFESVSGITTTGLTTLATVEGASPTFLFARAWLQWMGGLGIVVLTLALLFRPGVASRKLLDINWAAEGIVWSTRPYARRVISVYLILTAAGFLVLLALGVDAFPALLHTLAAVSTGGFSSYDRSLAALGGWPVQAGAVLVSATGAVSLGLYYSAFRNKWRSFFSDVEVRGLFAACVLSTLAIGASLYLADGFSLPGALHHAPLLAFSAQTTTGFSTVDVAFLGNATLLLIVFSMLTGGNIGSTAGGMKTFRLLVLMRMLGLMVARTRLPVHAVSEPRIQGQKLGGEEIEMAFQVMFLFVAVVSLSWIPFVAMGYDGVKALFEVASATGTVGLTAGISRPGLEPFLKGVLCADMLMGRLEIVAIMVFLYPGTWLGRRITPR